MRRVVLGVGAVAAVFASVNACGVGTDCDFGLCAGEPADAVSDGGPDGIGPDAVAPPDDSFALFVDAFNHEYSRDAEPVGGGHGDHYYYQMIDFIRQF